MQLQHVLKKDVNKDFRFACGKSCNYVHIHESEERYSAHYFLSCVKGQKGPQDCGYI